MSEQLNSDIIKRFNQSVNLKSTNQKTQHITQQRIPPKASHQRPKETTDVRMKDKQQQQLRQQIQMHHINQKRKLDTASDIDSIVDGVENIDLEKIENGSIPPPNPIVSNLNPMTHAGYYKNNSLPRPHQILHEMKLQSTEKDMVNEILEQMKGIRNITNNLDDDNKEIFMYLLRSKTMEKSMEQTKAKKVPPTDMIFDGTQKFWDVFQTFVLWADLYNIKMNEWLKIWIVHILKGKVKDKVMHNYNNINSFDELVEYLLQQKVMVKDINLMIQNLRNSSQLKTQDVLQFADYVIELWNAIQREKQYAKEHNVLWRTTPIPTEEEVYDIIMCGIRDKEVMDILKIKEYETNENMSIKLLKTNIKHCINITNYPHKQIRNEYNTKSINRNSGFKRNRPTNMGRFYRQGGFRNYRNNNNRSNKYYNNQSRNYNNNNQLRNNFNRFGKRRNENQNINRQNVNNNKNNNKRNNRVNNNNLNQNKRYVKCYNCGQMGHYAKECENKKKNFHMNQNNNKDIEKIEKRIINYIDNKINELKEEEKDEIIQNDSDNFKFNLNQSHS